jgi:hypothetical protein
VTTVTAAFRHKNLCRNRNVSQGCEISDPVWASMTYFAFEYKQYKYTKKTQKRGGVIEKTTLGFF